MPADELTIKGKRVVSGSSNIMTEAYHPISTTTVNEHFRCFDRSRSQSAAYPFAIPSRKRSVASINSAIGDAARMIA